MIFINPISAIVEKNGKGFLLFTLRFYIKCSILGKLKIVIRVIPMGKFATRGSYRDKLKINRDISNTYKLNSKTNYFIDNNLKK